MGEAEEKTEEKKVEERKSDTEVKGKDKKGKEGNGADKKEERKGDGSEKKSEKDVSEKKVESETPENKAPPQPPPDEIIMRVYMHCEGCAKSVRRSLRGLQGVEEVKTDCHAHKVTVKGKADPLTVVDRVQRKSGRKVELLTPVPPKPGKEEKPKSENEEKSTITAVVLKVHIHCEACSLEIKRRILRMKGVEEAEADMKKSQVTVKGEFETGKLLEYVYKRTGKHAVVVRAEESEGKKEKGEKVKEEKEKKDLEKGTKDGGVVTRNPLQYHYPRYQMEYSYPPQIFSDENPNACIII